MTTLRNLVCRTQKSSTDAVDTTSTMLLSSRWLAAGGGGSLARLAAPAGLQARRSTLLHIAGSARAFPQLNLTPPLRSASSSAPRFAPESAGNGETQGERAFVDRVVDRLNASIRAHPGDTLAVLFASDIGSIGAMYGLLSLSGAVNTSGCDRSLGRQTAMLKLPMLMLTSGAKGVSC